MHLRRLFVLAFALASIALLLLLLLAGCGGSSSPGVANVGSQTTTAATTTPTGATTAAGTLGAAVAFARCMRSHGIPGWPDPTSSGVFDKSKLRQLGLSVSRVRALEAGPCDQLTSGAPSQVITAADRVGYEEAAACMRRHGYPGFPNPTFPSNTVTVEIPPSIDQDSPSFKTAATTCTRSIPAGLPYSRATGP